MICVKELRAGYGRSVVLDSISFTVETGQIVGILGRNGCGKTTLLKCLNGLLRPMSGTILLHGWDLLQMSRQQAARTAALVPQSLSSPFALSVRDTILLGAGCRLQAWQSPTPDMIDEAASYAEALGIAALLDRSFRELSGGEQQLVLLARAQMQQAPILLLDEPTAHLDFPNRYRILDVVSKLAQDHGCTVVLTAHDPNLVLEYCTHVLLMDHGHILTSGPSSETITDHWLKTLYGDRICMQATAAGPVVVAARRNP